MVARGRPCRRRGHPGSTVSALVRWSEAGSQQWGEFIGLHWNGALQRGLASGVASNEPRVYLLPLVREIRKSIAFYRKEVIPRTGSSGPWEVSVGLRGIGGSLLQPFTAQGGYYTLEETPCADDSVLIKIELDEWTDGLVRQLAYRIAACWSVGPELVDHAFDAQREQL